MLADGQVRVDMGTPILEGPKVPTTLAPTQGSTVVQQDLVVEGKTYKVTCVSMGNPHAVIYSCDGEPIKVGSGGVHSSTRWPRGQVIVSGEPGLASGHACPHERTHQTMHAQAEPLRQRQPILLGDVKKIGQNLNQPCRFLSCIRTI